MHRRKLLAAALPLLGFVLSNAGAQGAYPSRPITLIVPYAGGSGSDSQARVFAEQLSKILRQPVVVQNKPGANAAIGMRAAGLAPADGYTLVLGGGSPMVINPLLTKNLGYDPSEFIHVSGVSKAFAGYVVGPQFPHKTLDAALKAARAERKALGVGTYAALYELGLAWLGELSGAPLQNVSYKGGSAVIADVIGGHLPMAFVELSTALPLVREGKARILAVASDVRSPDFEGVPLVKDIYPDYVVAPWTSLLVRAGTPSAIVSVLSSAMKEAFKSAPAHAYFTKSSLLPLNLSDQEMKVLQEAETARWRTMAAAAKVIPQ